MPLYIDHEILNWGFKDAQENEYDKKKINKFPYEIKFVDNQLNEEILKDFTGERTGFVQVGPKKWFFPSRYAKEAENYYNFKLRKDDVFVATFPRSGTTWTQEMVWLLCNNLDYKTAASIPLSHRFIFLEFSSFVHKDTKKEFLKENQYDPEKYQLVKEIDYPKWKILERFTERRFIKTHLPFSLLPPNIKTTGCKVIYVARNPKDVAVSFYHHNKSIRTQGYQGDFPKYWEYFERNLQPWTPYWDHIIEGWNHRHEKNVLFLFYENMVENLRRSIETVANFLDKSLSTEELDALENHLKFENFKNNKSVNNNIMKRLGIISSTTNFVRKGKNGGWKDYFDQELEKRANQWTEENLKRTDLRFPM